MELYSNLSAPTPVEYDLSLVPSLARHFFVVTHITSDTPTFSLSALYSTLSISFTCLFVLVLTVLVTYTFFCLHRTRTNTPLQDVPGPWFASCSILYRFYYAVLQGNWHNDLTNLHRKYGNIVRIAPNEVSIWDPRAVSEVYAYGDKGYPKCEMYDIALPNGYFNLAVERDIARHARGRRAIAKDYTLASTLTNEPYFDAVIHDFVTALDANFASNGAVCDFTLWSEFFTYDIITDILFGKAFGFCKAAKDVGGGIRDLRQMLDLSPLLSYMPWIWSLTKNKRVKAAGQSHYSTSTRREIEARLRDGNNTGRSDLLQGLLEAQYQDGSALPLGEITNHAYIFLLAAPDTASVALRKIVLNLAQHPDTLSKLLSQLRDARLSSPPTWAELQTVPLLSAVVKETLRLHPPAGFTLPRAVPEGGRTLCGKYLPEGTTVGMSAWCVHANTEFWGEDTNKFVPERWLDPLEAMKLERYGLSFGQGARGCLGKSIAMVQLVKATAQLVLNFEWGLYQPERIRDIFLLLVVVDGMRVKITRRKGGPLDLMSSH